MTTVGEPTRFSLDGTLSGSVGLTISVRSNGESVTIAMRGELDIASAPQLRRTLTACLASTTSDIDVDVGTLAFIDAAGLGILVGVNTELGHDGRCLRVRNPSPMCEHLFRINRLDFLFGSTVTQLYHHVSPIRPLDRAGVPSSHLESGPIGLLAGPEPERGSADPAITEGPTVPSP